MIYALLISLLYCLSLYGKSGIQPEEELGLPTIAWPAPIFAFGQNILYAKTVSPEVYTYYTDGPNNNLFEVYSRLLYGITNRWVIFTSIPYFQIIEDGVKSTGIGDITFATEYAFYQDTSKDHITQFTTIGQLQVPTGNPNVSRSTTSVFVGATASNISDKWYTYGSVGILFSAKAGGTSFGRIVQYDFGMGRTLFFEEDAYFAHFLVEFSGTFTEHIDQTNTATLKHIAGPGGNQFFAGPTLLIGSNTWILYIGFQYPLSQTIFASTGGYKSSFTMGYALDLYLEF